MLQSIAQSKVVWYVEEKAIQLLSTIAKSHAEALPFLQRIAQMGNNEAIVTLAEY